MPMDDVKAVCDENRPHPFQKFQVLCGDSANRLMAIDLRIAPASAWAAESGPLKSLYIPVDIESMIRKALAASPGEPLVAGLLITLYPAAGASAAEPAAMPASLRTA